MDRRNRLTICGDATKSGPRACRGVLPGRPFQQPIDVGTAGAFTRPGRRYFVFPDAHDDRAPSVSDCRGVDGWCGAWQEGNLQLPFLRVEFSEHVRADESGQPVELADRNHRAATENATKPGLEIIGHPVEVGGFRIEGYVAGREVRPRLAPSSLLHGTQKPGSVEPITTQHHIPDESRPPHTASLA